jgi:hypothetical protein
MGELPLLFQHGVPIRPFSNDSIFHCQGRLSLFWDDGWLVSGENDALLIQPPSAPWQVVCLACWLGWGLAWLHFQATADQWISPAEMTWDPSMGSSNKS